MSSDILEGEEMFKHIPSFWGRSTKLGAEWAAEAEGLVGTIAGVRGTRQF